GHQPAVRRGKLQRKYNFDQQAGGPHIMSSRSRFHEGGYSGKSRNLNSAKSLRTVLTRALQWLLWF
ncbi:MAG: hypothetical protein ACK6D4_01750, partial [Planctomyces sp.]